jgi:hypothetical protein
MYISHRAKTGWILGTSFDFWHGQGGNIHAIKKKSETLVVPSKKTGQEVNAEQTKHVVIPRDHHTRQKPQYKDR